LALSGVFSPAFTNENRNQTQRCCTAHPIENNALNNGISYSFTSILFSMKTQLHPDEKIIKEGAANLQKNIETVGGKLYLTNQRLVFEAHSFNVQSGTSELALSNVQSLRPCWTKFLGFIPLLPNSLAVYSKQGDEYRFVLFGRHAWAAAIDAQRAQ
jgi:hypothetical protein